MQDQQKLLEKVSQIETLLKDLKDTLTLPDVTPSTPDPAEESSIHIAQFEEPEPEDATGFLSLKKALFTDKWPNAVNHALICHPDREEDKVERGRGIIELMIEENIHGLKFLDYGCGEGHSTVVANEYGARAVGYDPKRNQRWESHVGIGNNLVFTDDFEEVKKKGPYNVILLFDVLDHVINQNPIEMMNKIKDLLTENGKVYLRTHPFTSRHGTHLYHHLNKAFIHLIFTPEELNELVPEQRYKEPSIGVIYPLKTYHDIFVHAGLQVETRRDITEKVEPFFRIPKIADRIMKHIKVGFFPEFQMSLQFIDYVLKK